jgi:hypothetical protein
MLCSLSPKLGDSQLDEITRLEQELGHPLLAFSCYPSEPARLTDAQLDRIKELESRLGISLVAVQR